MLIKLKNNGDCSWRPYWHLVSQLVNCTLFVFWNNFSNLTLSLFRIRSKLSNFVRCAAKSGSSKNKILKLTKWGKTSEFRKNHLFLRRWKCFRKNNTSVLYIRLCALSCLCFSRINLELICHVTDSVERLMCVPQISDIKQPGK